MVDVTLKDRRREKKRLAQKAQQSHRCRRTCSEAEMAMDSPCRHVEWHDMEEAYTVEECAKKKKTKIRLLILNVALFIKKYLTSIQAVINLQSQLKLMIP